MNKANVMVAVLFSSLLFPLVTWAESLPDYYPPSFRTWGVIDRLDIERGEAVIGDVKMSLSDNIHVYTLSSRFSSVHSLHAGLKVGIAMSARGNEIPLVTDIWVLPADYSHPLR
jgi:hypothetical protein